MAASSKDLLIIELKDTISQLNTTIKAQSEMISSLQNTISNLNAQLEYMKQKMFGASSEKSKAFPGQLGLFPEEENPTEIIEAEIIEVSSYKKQRKSKATYDEMFVSLPVRQVKVNTLTDEQKLCPLCNTPMIPIGTEVIRSEVIYHRPRLERIEYIGTTYECPACKDTEEPQFIKDNGIPALIPGSYASSSLAGHVIYEKFINAMPFYRLEQDFKRQFDVLISRTTMAHWSIYCAKQYLQPIYDLLHRKLLERRFLMADETPIQVLKEPGRRPQSKSYAWLFRTGEDDLPAIILYHYTPTRAGYNAAEFLKGAVPGYYLMVDGYTGYNKLSDYHRCVCWAHIRRYLLEAIPKGREKDFANPAVQGVLYCDRLFAYERSYRERGLSFEQRRKRRLKDEEPVIKAFLAWVDNQKPVQGDRLDRALTYIQNRRKDLTTYLEDGRCSFSNNFSENSIRPLTVGRKNYLFSDTQDGATASMTIYSILETAKAHGLNPLSYLTFLLDSRPNSDMPDEDLEKLLPWNEEVKAQCSNNLSSEVE